ncbi:WD40 repeat domain-containing protein [Streptomyces sp. NPDC101160]|uniref:WD40 repeat domain-containing protein n=1 Tax=Streptomyces sp. NPDC101160 TaxID=3366118 RepID=UPI0037F97D33
MPSVRAERPGAAALLGWLTDPEAPRLCLVTGGPGLLDWLAGHGPRAAGRRRTARALVPLTGRTALGTAWAVADRLGVVATSPADLVRALATTETGRAARTVLLLPALHSAAEPEAVALLLADLARLGRVRLVVEVRPGTPEYGTLAAAGRIAEVEGEDDEEGAGPSTASGPSAASGRSVGSGSSAAPTSSAAPAPSAASGSSAASAVDLSDPVAVCGADPVAVTTGYIRDPEPRDEHGGLRAAWLRAGQALCAAPAPSDRALGLLAVLGDGADPRLRPALDELAAASPWRVRWTRVAGDIAPPWPGPVAALAAQGGTLLVADLGGAVRLVGAADARALGRLDHPVTGRVRALAPAPDGTVLLLDERGRLHTVPGREPRAPYLHRLTEAVAATLSRHPGTALAAIAGSVVVGDRLGSVHAFGLTGLHQAALHSGRVTAVAAVESATPFVCSGGADGAVRVWTPGTDPDPAPLAERASPVVSLDAVETPYGPVLAAAWADGTVEFRRLEQADRLVFRPGPPVRAVAVTEDGAMVLGLDEVLVRLERRGR